MTEDYALNYARPCLTELVSWSGQSSDGTAARREILVEKFTCDAFSEVLGRNFFFLCTFETAKPHEEGCHESYESRGSRTDVCEGLVVKFHRSSRQTVAPMTR